MKNINIHNILIFLSIVGFMSCSKKDDFLNEKPDGSLSTITTLQDAENLLNNEQVFNAGSSPVLGQQSTDEYYVTDATWLGATQADQNAYLWNKRIYTVGSDVADWSLPYRQVYTCNIILDALKKIKFQPSEQERYNLITGMALFFRGYAFYNLMQVFTTPYNKQESEQSLGIPIRLNSDLNDKSFRATQKESYQQLIADIKTSAELMSTNSIRITLPSKLAAFGLLSRIYLSLSDFSNCKLYSDSCLAINNTINDYNDIVPEEYYLTSPSEPYLSENIFHSTMRNPTIGPFDAIVDSTLYMSYDNDDLRKLHFFVYYADGIKFKGSYDFHRGYLYNGITTAEVILNRAESNARNGALNEAMSDLNSLLIKRYKTGFYIPKNSSNKDEALGFILLERRKELCFRGLRWSDLRRLNQDPNYAKTLTRKINGATYILPANDPRYALPIPDNEIQYSGIQQNNR